MTELRIVLYWKGLRLYTMPMGPSEKTGMIQSDPKEKIMDLHNIERLQQTRAF